MSQRQAFGTERTRAADRLPRSCAVLRRDLQSATGRNERITRHGSRSGPHRTADLRTWRRRRSRGGRPAGHGRPAAGPSWPMPRHLPSPAAPPPTAAWASDTETASAAGSVRHGSDTGVAGYVVVAPVSSSAREPKPSCGYAGDRPGRCVVHRDESSTVLCPVASPQVFSVVIIGTVGRRALHPRAQF